MIIITKKEKKKIHDDSQQNSARFTVEKKKDHSLEDSFKRINTFFREC